MKPRISINIYKILPSCSDWEASTQQAGASASFKQQSRPFWWQRGMRHAHKLGSVLVCCDFSVSCALWWRYTKCTHTSWAKYYCAVIFLSVVLFGGDTLCGTLTSLAKCQCAVDFLSVVLFGGDTLNACAQEQFSWSVVRV